MRDWRQYINSGFLFVLAVLTPVWFLPITADTFGVQKQFLFMFAGIVMSALWLYRVVREKRVLFSFSPINLSSLLLMLAVLASAYATTRIETQLSGRFLSMVAMSLLLFFGFSGFSNFTWSKLLKGLSLGSILLAIVTWWQFLVPEQFTFSSLVNSTFQTQFATGVQFTLAESTIVLLAVLVPVLMANGFALWKNVIKSRRSLETIGWNAGVTAFLGATLVAIIFNMVQHPELRPILLPFQYGWGIAIENWKYLPRLFLGIGPEQFSAAFHGFRDVSFNLTDLWALRFRANTSEALHSLTTIGLLGFSAWMMVYAAGFWVGRKIFKANPGLLIFYVAQFALFWLIPLSATTIMILTLTLLAIAEEARQKNPNSAQDIIVLLSAIQIGPSGQLKTKKTSAGFAYATAAVLGVGLLFLTYFAGRVYASQMYYWFSLKAAQQNEITRTYELQQVAIQLAPYNSQIRRAYSITNLAIASSMAQNPDITEEEQQIFTELLQQAIREARLAAQVNPAETENWEHLSLVYSNILDVEGSADWAVAGLTQAIQLDPISPQLRIQLGNLYFNLGATQDALAYYEQGIQLKPDWYVPFFHYGVALRSLEQPQPQLAVQAFTRALELVPEGETEDYAVIEQQLNLAKEEAEALGSDEETTAEGTLPAADQPTVPDTTPSGENFEELLQEEQPEDTGENDNIVLPEDVGF